jgi:hypothetical protein
MKCEASGCSTRSSASCVMSSHKRESCVFVQEYVRW